MKNPLIEQAEDQQIERATELAEVAERLQNNLGPEGGLIVLGLLLNEGLHEVAQAIEKVADAMMKPYQH